MTYQLYESDMKSMRVLLERVQDAENQSGVCLDFSQPVGVFLDGEPIGYLTRAEDGLAWQASSVNP